ncbi:hypothetical protein [Lactobacillus sp. LL6]|uniref:hypothetical protein n=1 Tax=Lactobacillus sp. LL6 TaxID=2596827 RepID=UPI001185FEBA|nr:hypothetical protein [Lactobacillus sp. LL6]TSO26720.1 hypothetical protein FOD82_06560 [Lactobacillus sp. LL6]
MKEKNIKFIQYSLSGKIIKEAEFLIDLFKENPIGEKVRITLINNKQYIGFWDTLIEDQLLPEKIKVSCYDLDEVTGSLKSSKNITSYVPVNRIFKIEVILHSNPRWGVPITNKFIFIKSLK